MQQLQGGLIMDNNTAISKYIRKAKRIYHGDRKTKQRFIDDLQDALLCFSETHPGCTYADLTDSFGSPDEIREAFLKDSSKELKKRNLLIYRIVILCSVLIAIAILAFTVHLAVEQYTYSQGYFIKTIYDYEKTDSSEETEPIESFHFD